VLWGDDRIGVCVQEDDVGPDPQILQWSAAQLHDFLENNFAAWPNGTVSTLESLVMTELRWVAVSLLA
jgi:hypothetical protein